VALLLQILLLSIATAFISNVGSQILVGAGLVRLVAVALISGSAISFGVALALIPAYGLLGVAAGTVAASVIIDLIVIPWLVQRRMKLSVTNFLRQAAVRPALVCLLDVAALLAIRMTGRPTSWLHLICYGIASVSACAAITLAVGMTAAERQRFLLRPLRNLVARPG
jgi:O-antigen/teichoic acid export membrane protein